MRHHHLPGWVVLAAASCLALAVSTTVRSQAPTTDKAASTRPISFDTDIRPILAENCFACHGPDETKRKAKLHFDTREGAYSRPNVIVPGNTAKSLLIQHITSDDPDEHMPPPDSGHALTATPDRAAHAMDRRGRQVGHALGVRRADAPRAARRQATAVGEKSDRPVRPGPARAGGPAAVAGSRQGDAAAAPHATI